jgi:hypothetical protein
VDLVKTWNIKVRRNIFLVLFPLQIHLILKLWPIFEGEFFPIKTKMKIIYNLRKVEIIIRLNIHISFIHSIHQLITYSLVG